MSLNDDLVRQARLHTRNLSATIEELLGDFVEREHARRRDDDVVVDRVMNGFGVFHREHGLPSGEFSSL